MKKIREILFGDVKTKAVALILAVAIWTIAYMRTVEEKKIRATIDIQDSFSDKDILVRSQSTKNIEIEVEVPKSKEDKVPATITGRHLFDKKDIRFNEDIIIPITKKNFPGLDDEIRFKEVRPSHITVVLESPTVATKKVEAVVVGGVSDLNYKVVAITPPEVKVKGLKNVIAKTTSIKTSPIDVKGMGDKLESTVSLEDEDGKIVFVDRKEVKVIIVAERKKLDEREFKLLPENIFLTISPDFPYKVELRKEIKKVIIAGKKPDLDGLTTENIKAYVIIDEKIHKPAENPYESKLHFILPEGLEVKGPPSIDIIIKKKNKKTP